MEILTFEKMEVIASDLLSSSSSSSDSGAEAMFWVSSQRRNKRRRVVHFVSNVVDNYTDEEFQRNFRLQRTSAEQIIAKYIASEFCKANVGRGRKHFEPRSQMLAFLWFCANKNSYREISNLFNMSQSTFLIHMKAILDFFTDISKTVIKFPEADEEKQQVAEEFKQIASFKDVIGCIDGCYLPIRKPANKIRSTYINRHDMLSITLQGICDANKKFLDVCIGSPSKIHDARIFALSPISDRLPTVCQQRYHILGDAAYPIREYLLTPYRHVGNITAKQRRYNIKHAQTRVKIENAFGLLKTRFRQLMRMDFFTVERMCKFVMACCVLHNMCIGMDDIIEEDEELQQVNQQPNEPDLNANNPREAALRRLGEMKRNDIADTLRVSG